MKKRRARFISICRAVVVLSCAQMLIACAPKLSIDSTEITGGNWMAEVVNYRYTLPANHPDNVDAMFALPSSTKRLIRSKFGGLPKKVAIRELATWLNGKGGYNIKYQVDANLSPREAFEQRVGNCLSFTMLLATLADELDIEIEYNEVDIPELWGFSEESGMVSYRHVNAVYRGHAKSQVFDLAIENYRFEYPQRAITREQALAKLHSNRAVQHLGDNPTDQTLHSMKLAVSLAPQSSELWANLGVVYRRQGIEERAEQAYLKSLLLDPNNAGAASNLERLYRTQGKIKKADRFGKVAYRARRNNPYYHYNVASRHFERNSLRKAKSAILSAIRLHNSDPRFYELKSRIAQREFRYVSAIKDLERAYKVTQTAGERERYANKARLVTERAIEKAKREERRIERTIERLRDQTSL